jgi:hypothetical protein
MHELNSVVMVDAHVHVHPQADPGVLLTMAVENFGAAAQRLNADHWQGVLLLTEMAGANWFEAVYPGATGTNTLGKWAVTGSAAEDISMRASAPQASLIVVAGRQIVTAERVEVLAVGTRTRIADGQSLQATIVAAHKARATVVLPWAVGKWIGRRGKLVASAVQRAGELRLFVGDNAGRPVFWPAPQIFQQALSQGRPVLPGSDPLPLKDQERRVGSMGFWIKGRLPVDAPGAALKDWLMNANPEVVKPFGRLETPWRFMRNQVALRVSRR